MNPTPLLTISFSVNELAAALLTTANRQGRLPNNIWEDMKNEEKNKEYRMELTHSNEFGTKLDIYHKGAKL